MSESRRAPLSSMAPRHVSRKGGRLAREHVSNIQRARMLAAMAEVAAERGAANVTVTDVVERAGVSRRTFYELFDDIEDCFLAAVEESVLRARERVLSAYSSESLWRESIRAGIVAFLQFLDENPAGGKLLVVEMLAGGRRALECRARVLQGVITAVEAGGSDRRTSPIATRLTAEGVVGAVLGVIHGRLLEVHAEPLVRLVNPLMSIVVLPYLGSAAARRELERPSAEVHAHPPAASGNPLREIHMRLTYRTVRVLMAVAAHPGSSNRAIAEAAEVSDQGQISKLLSRLQRLGLIQNPGPSPARGEPNAWTLTQRGWQVHGAVVKRTVAA
jgi:AcrR family transcriptional regulator